MSDSYTSREMMIACGSRELHDDDAGLIGVGLPLLSGKVAKQTHAPNFDMLVEIGLADPLPEENPLGVGDVRIFHNPTFSKHWNDVMMKVTQRGDIDVGFLGAIQVDMYGNVNSSLIGDPDDPDRRFPGSGGANDIASNASRFNVILPLEKRRFPERVDFITSPGYISGDGRRDEMGLPGGGPDKVITDRALFTFEEGSERMQLHSVHPGETIEGVRDSVDFDLIIPDSIPETKPPTQDELEALRAFDPAAK